MEELIRKCIRDNKLTLKEERVKKLTNKQNRAHLANTFPKQKRKAKSKEKVVNDAWKSLVEEIKRDRKADIERFEKEKK